MKRLVVNANECTGCRACEMACSFAHDQVFSPSLARVRVVKLEQHGVDVPIVCRVCARPWCVAACPVGALRKDDKLSRIVVDAEVCTGCRMCVDACPFGCMELHPDQRVAMVCDLCGGTPNCVKRCPTGALRYRRVTDDAHAKREAVALGEVDSIKRRWESEPRPHEREVKPIM